MCDVKHPLFMNFSHSKPQHKKYICIRESFFQKAVVPFSLIREISTTPFHNSAQVGLKISFLKEYIGKVANFKFFIQVFVSELVQVNR